MGRSIVEAANKVLDFNAFKKDQTNALEELKKKNSKSKKSTVITAKKISKKYKNLKKPKKTFLVNEEDLETIAYADEPKDDSFKGESILEAANRVLDFEEFKKQQKDAINNFNENLLNKNKRKAIEKGKDIFNTAKKKNTAKRQSGTNSSKENIKKIQKY